MLTVFDDDFGGGRGDLQGGGLGCGTGYGFGYCGDGQGGGYDDGSGFGDSGFGDGTGFGDGHGPEYKITDLGSLRSAILAAQIIASPIFQVRGEGM